MLVVAGCDRGDREAAPPAPDPGGWHTLAEFPQPRTEHSAAALDGRLYVAGGFAADPALPTQLFIYDQATGEWREGAPLPEGRHHAGMAAYGGRVYLVGGYAGGPGEEWRAQETLFVYDVASDAWRAGPPMPEPRGAHAVAVTDDGRLHVIGGAAGAPRADHFVFDTESETWSTLPPMPTPREHIGAAYLDGVIYVAAGRDAGESAMPVFEAYDVDTREWTELPDLPTGRSGVAVVAFQEHVYVFGGESFNLESRTYAESERFDPAAGVWQSLPPMPTARHGLGAGVVGDGILVVGGGPEAGLTYSGVAELWRP